MAPVTAPPQSAIGHSIRVFFAEGERTMDRRVFDINSINFNRPPPLPVRIQLTEPESGGHAGATICGVINKVYRDGHVIIGEGPLDLGSAAGIEAERLIREGFLQTWSPEVGDETVDVEINVTDEDSNTPQDELAHFRVATWLGVSLVALPALSSAVVELLDISGNVISPAPQRLGPESTDAGESHVPVDPAAPQEIIDRIVMSDGDAVTAATLLVRPNQDAAILETCPEQKVPILSVKTASGFLADEEVVQDDSAETVSLSVIERVLSYLTSSALSVLPSFLHDSASERTSDATPVRPSGIKNSKKSAQQQERNYLAAPSLNLQKDVKEVLPPKGFLDTSNSLEGGPELGISGGRRSSSSSRNTENVVPSVGAKLNYLQVLDPAALDTLTTTTKQASSEAGSAHPVIGDLVPSSTIPNSFDEPSTISKTEKTVSRSPVYQRLLQSLLAAGGNRIPINPPSIWFENPKLPDLQRFITITDEGRIFGHLAGLQGECHIGFANTCITTPRSQHDYAYFRIGQVKTAEGTLVATGCLTLRGGHAGSGMTASDAQKHYDDTDSAFADVTVGEDEEGIWFSGALRPETTPETLRRVLASGVSGDWRMIEGNLELIGVCSVNTPGFPKASARLVACGECEDGDLEIVTLVAAGGPPLPSPDLSPDDRSLIHNLARQSPLIDSYIDEIAASLPPSPHDKTPIR